MSMSKTSFCPWRSHVQLSLSIWISSKSSWSIQ